MPIKSSQGAYEAAYKRIQHRDIDMRVGAGDNAKEVEVEVNSHSLNSRIPQNSLRSRIAYDYPTGQYHREPMDVLENAQHHINRLKTHGVTNRLSRPEKEEKMPSWMNNPVGMATPVAIKKVKKRKKV